MKEFDFNLLAGDQGIHLAPEGHKHTRPGWVNLECPFCSGNPGYHLGFRLDEFYFFCWRCGWHPAWEVIGELLDLNRYKAELLISQYPARPRLRTEVTRIQSLTCKLPPGTGPLLPIHKKYLRGRKFDPDKIETEWGILGTKGIGGYAFRIINPIYFDDQLVSYHSRDVTGLNPTPHKACPDNEEVRPHKNCLYGYDKTNPNWIVVTEGITDVWRLGPGAVATFGIQYSEAQVRLLRNWPRVIVLYDSGEPEAIQQARKLAADLQAFRIKVELIFLEVEDPALLSQADADELMGSFR